MQLLAQNSNSNYSAVKSWDWILSHQALHNPMQIQNLAIHRFLNHERRQQSWIRCCSSFLLRFETYCTNNQSLCHEKRKWMNAVTCAQRMTVQLEHCGRWQRLSGQDRNYPYCRRNLNHFRLNLRYPWVYWQSIWQSLKGNCLADSPSHAVMSSKYTVVACSCAEHPNLAISWQDHDWNDTQFDLLAPSWTQPHHESSQCSKGRCRLFWDTQLPRLSFCLTCLLEQQILRPIRLFELQQYYRDLLVLIVFHVDPARMVGKAR